MLLGAALPLAEELVVELRSTGLFERVEYAGSVRRGRETIGDLDILAVSADPMPAVAAFLALPEVVEILSRGETKHRAARNGTQVDLRVVPSESFARRSSTSPGPRRTTSSFGSSPSHGVEVERVWALRRDDKPLAGKDEAGVYRALASS